MTYRHFSQACSWACGISLWIVVQTAFAQPGAPVYDIVTYSDPTWTEVSTGVWEVAASSDDPASESWERPIEGDKFTNDGTTLSETGKYYGFADLKTFRVGADDTYLYLSWETNVDFQDDGGSRSSSAGKGMYVFYMDTPNVANGFALVKSDPSGLGTTYTNSSAGKFFDDNKDGVQDAPGASIFIAGEGGDGFESEDSSVNIWSRFDGSTLFEMAVDYTTIHGGLTESDFDLNTVDYMFGGIGVSNPSSSTDLFANDHFGLASPGSQSVEFDSAFVSAPTPEPSSLSMLGVAAFAVLLRGRRGHQASPRR